MYQPLIKFHPHPAIITQVLSIFALFKLINVVMKKISQVFKLIVVVAILLLPTISEAKSLSKSNSKTIETLESGLQSSYPGSYFDGRDLIVYISLGNMTASQMDSFKTEEELQAFRDSFIESFYNSAAEEWANDVQKLFKNTQIGIIFVLSNNSGDVVVLRIDGRDF